MSKLTHAKHARHAPENATRRLSSRAASHTPQRAARHTSTYAARHAAGSNAPRELKHRRFHERAQRKQGISIAAKSLVGLGGVLLAAIVVVVIGVFAYTGRLDAILAANGDEAANKALQDSRAHSDANTSAEQEGVFYVLLLGSDWREGNFTSQKESEQADNQRSDVIMLVRVDMPNRRATLVSIPRDTPYREADGRLVKINERYNEAGAAGMIEAVSSLTGVPISHYVTVSFSQLESIVDLLGGVSVEVPLRLEYKDALTGEMVTVEAGTQVLTGKQAQIFARSRHEFSEYQDMNRQNNVRMLLGAILQKITEIPLSELPDTTLQLAHYVGTDMRFDNLVSLAWDFVSASQESRDKGAGAQGDGLAGFTIYSCTGPYEGAINEETGMWLCYEDPEGWAKLMEAVDRGEDPALVMQAALESQPVSESAE